VDQYLDNRQKEILWDVLANPADNGAAYAQNLARLVQDNPQSGILQLLYARTADAKQLSKAAIYGNPRTLHKVVNHPQDLPVIDSASIIYASDNLTPQPIYLNPVAGDELKTEVVSASIDAHAFNNGYESLPPIPAAAEEQAPADINDTPVANNEQLEVLAAANKSVEETTEAPVIDTDNYPELPRIPEEADQLQPALPVEEQTAATEPVGEADPKDAKEVEEQIIMPEPILRPVNQYNSRFPKRDVPPAAATPEPEYAPQDIDDEIYDEIVSIDDIGFKAVESQSQPVAEQFTEVRFSDPGIADAHDDEPSPVLFHQPETVIEPVQEYDKQQASKEEERLILGGIVNADYLRFDKKLDELRNAAPPQAVSTQQASQMEIPAAETQEMARYDDDNMPYTFMWWLNKTRKEHAENLQPYAQPAPAVNNAGIPETLNKSGELQHQYYENILTLTSVSSIERNADTGRVAFDPEKKEDVIIERFIHTEPQIKPLSADKLDNENKAKKSSEDQNDFVTETLARIYTDQMLYHKAIATYKKLMLRFPEKNLYFATRIEELEKKTN
jgi:hypothetical protein